MWVGGDQETSDQRQTLRDWAAGKSVIVSSVPLVVPTGPPEARDGWASGGGDTGYARELRGIIDELRAAGADNVLWLTADVHFAAFWARIVHPTDRPSRRGDLAHGTPGSR